MKTLSKWALCISLGLSIVNVANAQSAGQKAETVVHSAVAGVGCPLTLVLVPTWTATVSAMGAVFAAGEAVVEVTGVDALVGAGNPERFQLVKYYYKDFLPNSAKTTAKAFCTDHLKAISSRNEKVRRDEKGQSEKAASMEPTFYSAM